MKSIFIFILFVGSNCWSQTILIQAQESSSTEFTDFLENHKEAYSLIKHYQTQVQQNKVQENQLFKLADSLDDDLARVAQSIKAVENQAPLTLLSLRYIRDLSEKALMKNIEARQRLEFLHAYCKTALLLNEAPIVQSCTTQEVGLGQLNKKFPNHGTLLIESLPFPVSDKNPLTVSRQTAYQWTLLSNTHTPIHFFGTFQQLINQQFQPETIIKGNCETFNADTDDFEVMNRASVFFSSLCQKKIKPIEEKKSWLKENRKTLLYTAGAIIMTGFMVDYMKDKEFTLDDSLF